MPAPQPLAEREAVLAPRPRVAAAAPRLQKAGPPPVPDSNAPTIPSRIDTGHVPDSAFERPAPDQLSSPSAVGPLQRRPVPPPAPSASRVTNSLGPNPPAASQPSRPESQPVAAQSISNNTNVRPVQHPAISALPDREPDKAPPAASTVVASAQDSIAPARPVDQPAVRHSSAADPTPLDVRNASRANPPRFERTPPKRPDARRPTVEAEPGRDEIVIHIGHVEVRPSEEAPRSVEPSRHSPRVLREYLQERNTRG